MTTRYYLPADKAWQRLTDVGFSGADSSLRGADQTVVAVHGKMTVGKDCEEVYTAEAHGTRESLIRTTYSLLHKLGHPGISKDANDWQYINPKGDKYGTFSLMHLSRWKNSKTLDALMVQNVQTGLWMLFPHLMEVNDWLQEYMERNVTAVTKDPETIVQGEAVSVQKVTLPVTTAVTMAERQSEVPLPPLQPMQIPMSLPVLLPATRTTVLPIPVTAHEGEAAKHALPLPPPVPPPISIGMPGQMSDVRLPTPIIQTKTFGGTGDETTSSSAVPIPVAPSPAAPPIPAMPPSLLAQLPRTAAAPSVPLPNPVLQSAMPPSGSSVPLPKPAVVTERPVEHPTKRTEEQQQGSSVLIPPDNRLTAVSNQDHHLSPMPLPTTTRQHELPNAPLSAPPPVDVLEPGKSASLASDFSFPSTPPSGLLLTTQQVIVPVFKADVPNQWKQEQLQHTVSFENSATPMASKQEEQSALISATPAIPSPMPHSNSQVSPEGPPLPAPPARTTTATGSFSPVGMSSAPVSRPSPPPAAVPSRSGNSSNGVLPAPQFLPNSSRHLTGNTTKSSSTRGSRFGDPRNRGSKSPPGRRYAQSSRPRNRGQGPYSSSRGGRRTGGRFGREEKSRFLEDRGPPSNADRPRREPQLNPVVGSLLRQITAAASLNTNKERWKEFMDRAQDCLKDGFSDAIVYIFQVWFGELWEHVVRIQPPWQGHHILVVLSEHRTAVFFEVLGKNASDLVEYFRSFNNAALKEETASPKTTLQVVSFVRDLFELYTFEPLQDAPALNMEMNNDQPGYFQDAAAKYRKARDDADALFKEALNEGRALVSNGNGTAPAGSFQPVAAAAAGGNEGQNTASGRRGRDRLPGRGYSSRNPISTALSTSSGWQLHDSGDFPSLGEPTAPPVNVQNDTNTSVPFSMNPDADVIWVRGAMESVRQRPTTGYDLLMFTRAMMEVVMAKALQQSATILKDRKKIAGLLQISDRVEKILNGLTTVGLEMETREAQDASLVAVLKAVKDFIALVRTDAFVHCRKLQKPDERFIREFKGRLSSGGNNSINEIIQFFSTQHGTLCDLCRQG